MSADLSDPNIVAKYQEIISFTSPTNWCVLYMSYLRVLYSHHVLRLLLSYGQVRSKGVFVRLLLSLSYIFLFSRATSYLCTRVGTEVSKSYNRNSTETSFLSFYVKIARLSSSHLSRRTLAEFDAVCISHFSRCFLP